MSPLKIAICIPTLNPGKNIEDFLWLKKTQGEVVDKFLIIDSESDDGSVQRLTDAGFLLHSIPRNEFNHGATREIARKLVDAEIVVFMTQDAILADPLSLQHLVENFGNPHVGAAYGRQLPALNASPIATHARLFNYPPISRVVSREDIPRLGVKAAFLSNSFAAYRREALQTVGGFPSDVIFGEDTFVAARMLQAGWKLAYCAEATCYHSHNYTPIHEFQRYFDMGVFHAREAWYLQVLGGAEGEGKRFVLSELRYLRRQAPALIPVALIRSAFKLIGYRLGRLERYLPRGIKLACSMNRGFWN
jgi:rhamnosyltransferase